MRSGPISPASRADDEPPPAKRSIRLGVVAGHLSINAGTEHSLQALDQPGHPEEVAARLSAKASRTASA